MTNKDTDKTKEVKEAPKDWAEQLATMENNWKRALADYQNLQKRVAEEKEDIVRFSNMVLISGLIPILDNLELVLKHSEDMGVQMILNEFMGVLEGAGLTALGVKPGDEFNPMVMDASEGDGNLVKEVLKKGYKLKDKLIRPAHVIVGKEEN